MSHSPEMIYMQVAVYTKDLLLRTQNEIKQKKIKQQRHSAGDFRMNKALYNRFDNT